MTPRRRLSVIQRNMEATLTQSTSEGVTSAPNPKTLKIMNISKPKFLIVGEKFTFHIHLSSNLKIDTTLGVEMLGAAQGYSQEGI